MIRFLDHGVGVFTAKKAIGPCRWDRFDLLCVHQGQLTLFVEGQEGQELSPGMGMLVYPYTRFEGRVQKGRSRVSVEHFMIEEQSRSAAAKPTDAARRPDVLQGVMPSVLPEVLQRLTGLRNGCQRVEAEDRLMLERDIRRALGLAFEVQSQAVIDQRVAMLVLILSQLGSGQVMRTGAMRQPWDDMSKWLADQVGRRVSVETMAGVMEMSTAHFSHRFKAVFGMSPGRYFQRLTIQESMRLLRETGRPIKTIAMSLGFVELPNFYRTFRGITGTSPRAYRQRHSLRG